VWPVRMASIPGTCWASSMTSFSCVMLPLSTQVETSVSQPAAPEIVGVRSGPAWKATTITSAPRAFISGTNFLAASIGRSTIRSFVFSASQVVMPGVVRPRMPTFTPQTVFTTYGVNAGEPSLFLRTLAESTGKVASLWNRARVARP